MDNPVAQAFETAINAGDITAVRAWVAQFGINTSVMYPVPGASFDAFIVGTPLAIAVHQKKADIALWLLQNGASQELYSYNSEAGYRQSLTYHPLGPALTQGLDSVVALMLEQGVDFHAVQRLWFEEWVEDEHEVFGKVVLGHEATRPVLERIGRLDVLESLAKEDFRTPEEREYAEAVSA
jgi:hypothetical protein